MLLKRIYLNILFESPLQAAIAVEGNEIGLVSMFASTDLCAGRVLGYILSVQRVPCIGF